MSSLKFVTPPFSTVARKAMQAHFFEGLHGKDERGPFQSANFYASLSDEVMILSFYRFVVIVFIINRGFRAPEVLCIPLGST